MRRPSSLAEVAAWSRARRDFWNHLADFLDQFYLERQLDMLQDEPARLAGTIDDGDVADAYLAATAVSLARSLAMVPPSWARRPDRKLHRPWFASSGPAIRATLLLESPAPFRERNLFVSENALTRA
jgi:hypothetical protein